MNLQTLKTESGRLIARLRDIHWPRLVLWLEDRSPRRLFLKALLAGLLVSVPWQCSRVLYDAYFAKEEGPVSVTSGTLPGPSAQTGSITGMPGPKAPRAEPLPAEATATDAPDASADGQATSPAETAPATANADRDAAVLQRVPPEYPTEALRDGRSGTVLLKVRIGADGTANAIDIEKSSGSRALDRAARDAVRQWRFSPKTAGGTAVESELSIPVDFKLDP